MKTYTAQGTCSRAIEYEVTDIQFLTTIICTPGCCEERILLCFAEPPSRRGGSADSVVRCRLSVVLAL